MIGRVKEFIGVSIAIIQVREPQITIAVVIILWAIVIWLITGTDNGRFHEFQ